MAGKSQAAKKVLPKSKIKQTAAEREMAATGKRVNRTGGRTSLVSELAGKSKAELQTMIRVLKDKKDKTALDTAKLDKAEDMLQQLRNKDRAEVGLASRKMEQGLADKKAKPVTLPPTPFNKGGLTQPSASQKGLKKLPTTVRNKMGYMNRGGTVKSGSTDMRKGGMFY